MPEIEKTIFINDCKINYRIRACSTSNSTANKCAILLLHGLASNLTRWSEFVANTSLHNNVDLLRVDLRGHGKSMAYQRIVMAQWCDDIRQILQTEHYSQFIIIGHSLGAQIAMHFAYRFPEYCKAVVLIDPVFPSALKGSLNLVRRLRYGLLVLIYSLLFVAKMGIKKKTLPYRDLQQLDINTRKILNSKSDSNIAKLYMNPFADLKYIPLLNYCQDIFEVTRKIPDLTKINCAVLCLLSKGATISNIEITKNRVDCFANNETQIIDADHWLLTEKPDAARTAIDNWCRKILEL